MDIYVLVKKHAFASLINFNIAYNLLLNKKRENGQQQDWK